MYIVGPPREAKKGRGGSGIDWKLERDKLPSWIQIKVLIVNYKEFYLF